MVSKTFFPILVLVFLSFGSGCDTDNGDTATTICADSDSAANRCSCGSGPELLSDAATNTNAMPVGSGLNGCGEPSFAVGTMRYIAALNVWGIVPTGQTDYYTITNAFDDSLKVDQMGIYFTDSGSFTLENCTPDQPFFPGGCSNAQITVGEVVAQAELYNCPAIPKQFPMTVVDSSGNPITTASLAISYAPQDGSATQTLAESEGELFTPPAAGIYTVVISAPGYLSQTVTWEVVRNICELELFGPTTFTLLS